MKKLLTVFLIMALVLSFFVACDSDSGSGGSKKATPTDAEKETVWSISLSVNEVIDVVLGVYADYLGDDLEGAIDEELGEPANWVLGDVRLKCDGEQTIDADIPTKTLDFDLAFKPYDNSDAVLCSVLGTVVDKEFEPSFEVTTTFDMVVSFNETTSPTGKALNLKASLVYVFNASNYNEAATLSVNYSKVNLNGVEYDASAFQIQYEESLN